jgi:hypothetical protein
MAGERNRIWPARLIVGILVLAIALGAAIVVGRAWWLSSTMQNDSESHVAPAPVPGETGSEAPRGSHPLDPVLEMARRSLGLHRSRDRDYTAIMGKRLRIGSKLGEPEVMRLKLRSRASDLESESEPRPIDVYLGFEQPKSLAGREVLWRQGLEDDQMIVHEAGFLNLARVRLAPTSRLAMLGNRYPISDIGIERLLLKLIDIGTRDRLLGDCEVSIREGVVVAGRLCRRIEVVHPQKTAEIDGQKFEFAYYRAEIDIDVENELPIHYASYLWPEQADSDPLLDEEFTYQELRLNCDLSDLDFDPDNPEYRYPSR